MCSFVAPERSSCHSWAVVVAPGYAGCAGWVDWTHQSFRILGATEGMSHKTFLQDPGGEFCDCSWSMRPFHGANCVCPDSRFHSGQASLDLPNFWEVKHHLSEWRLVKKITPKEILFNVFLFRKRLGNFSWIYLHIGSLQVRTVSTAHRSMAMHGSQPAGSSLQNTAALGRCGFVWK